MSVILAVRQRQDAGQAAEDQRVDLRIDDRWKTAFAIHFLIKPGVILGMSA